MSLYPLLKDRACINVLKILYDNELIDKRYTMSYTQVEERISVSGTHSTLENLESAGLVSSEYSEEGILVLSITKKGKEFIEQFDRLIDVMNGKKEDKKAYQVKYELTSAEQRVLIMCSKMRSESGTAVMLKALTQEVYPYTDPLSKTRAVSNSAKRLEELNLIKRIKNNNRIFFDVTETGEKVIKEQFMDGALIST
ncbi:MAG: hypothetical protein V1729_06395 [Candidatus Woesearchaeota archaeon]